MTDRSPPRRLVEERDEVAGHHPDASQKVVVSRDIIREWRGLGADAWRSEGWDDVGALTAPGPSDD